MIQTTYQINDKGVGHHENNNFRKNIELTEGLKQAVEEKLSKLEKFFKPDTDVYVTLSVERIDRKSRLLSRQRDMLSVQSRSAMICTYQLTS